MLYTSIMRTTLTLDDDVSACLHKLQRELGISFKDAVNLTLRKGMEQLSSNLIPAPSYKVTAHSMGLPPGMNYDNIGELLDQIEGVDHP